MTVRDSAVFSQSILLVAPEGRRNKAQGEAQRNPGRVSARQATPEGGDGTNEAGLLRHRLRGFNEDEPLPQGSLRSPWALFRRPSGVKTFAADSRTVI